MAKASKILQQSLQAYNDGYRLIANKGGARSTKTWSVLQLLLTIASAYKYVISVVSESLPHLKIGALRDFENILNNANLIEGVHYSRNRASNTFKIGESVIEFYSCTSEKAHGAQRDILFINEANHLEWEVFRQLSIRTAKTIFIDFNPASFFWYDERLAHLDTTKQIHSTYRDNPFLSAEQVSAIEAGKNDLNWWRVYGLGETGTNEGLVFDSTNWAVVSEMPENYRARYCGIDFGFTNDPTAIVEVRVADGELWVDCPVYVCGLLNDAIAERLRANGFSRYSSIVADSAELKSIAEINARGFNVQPVVKGADSIRAGIQILKRYKINVTERSVDLIQELRKYSWKQERSGHWLNVPNDRDNHALDALRYVALTFLKATPPSGVRRITLGHY